MLFFLAAAHAGDSPHLFFKQGIGVSGWPSGLLSTTILEARTPLHRSDSVVFQNTYAGVGLDVQASPAFVIGEVRASFAPLDVFDVNLRAGRGYYFDNGLGLLPFDQLAGTLESSRDPRADEGFGAWMWDLGAEPTLKAKLWKIVFFDAWTVDWLITERPAAVTAPFTYEPLRDLVIAFEDVAFEQHVGLLFEAMDGKSGPMLMFGPTYRDRWAHVSGDRSATVGLLVATRPSKKPIVPTFAGLALWYVLDTDRVGPMPYLALQAQWEVEKRLGRPKG